MDFEDEADASDSQAVLAVVKNHTTLDHEQGDEIIKKETNELENDWNGGYQTLPMFAADDPIQLPPPPLKSLCPMLLENEPDSTFADGLEALFSTDHHSNHLGDVIDSEAEAGVCGLRNLGNTCFMSTGVQCLMATPALVLCLLSQTSVPTQEPDTLTSHFSQLTHKMWSGHFSTVHPADFKESLGVHYPQFKDFRQHDCQEFLALLLDGLHEQMNSSSLHNKLQNIYKADCDADICSKEPFKQVPSILSKSTSPSHNNFDKIADIFRKKTPDNNVPDLRSIHVDKKINNCVVNDISKSDSASKQPLLVNKCDNDGVDHACDASSIDQKELTPVHFSRVDNKSASVLNNHSQRLTGLEDIIKDAKTSNVNVLVTEQEVNNEIKFDSDKFPKSENIRRKETFNFNSFHLYDNNVSSGKRGKSTVTHYQNSVDFREGLDLKRLKLHRNEQTQVQNDPDSIMECDWEKNHRMEDERKLKVGRHLDKNYKMECERLLRDGPGCNAGSMTSVAGALRHVAQTESDHDADIHWQKHLAAHQSAIVDTFQGQFKSTVVCSTCNHVSVTYEPFMYLSVPLPHAMELQLIASFVSVKDSEPLQYLLTVNKGDSVRSIKEQLLNIIGRPIPFLVIAEVLNCHISKILDDNYLVRFINSTNRNLYAFEVVNFSCYAPVENSGDGDKTVSTYSHCCESNDDINRDACNICLEEKESGMSRHVDCVCILCDSCIVELNQHYGKVLKCPVCHEELILGVNLVSLGLTPDTKPPVRMMNVSLVFRLNTDGNGSNNTRTVQLFGHPRLLRLPNRLLCAQLHEAVAAVTPYTQEYKILLVDGEGHHCSRCMFNTPCRGCPVATEGSLVLMANDSLAAMFVNPVPEISLAEPCSTLQHSAVNNPLTLYDCIQAFSQSEKLDENNPWYCPNCQKNQCATKTLSVWRYPNYLIIYLKRFVFQDCVSTKLDDKVIFPLCGLNLSQNSSLYDLYASVCHVGGVSAGHYTAYTQHPRTGEWHHYNDDYVTKQPPQDEDYSNAYILFYKKRGADQKNEDFNAKLISLKSETLS